MKRIQKIVCFAVVVIIIAGAGVVFVKSQRGIKVNYPNTPNPPVGSFDGDYLNVLDSPEAFDDALRDIPDKVKGDPQKFLNDKLLPFIKTLESLQIEKLSKEQLGDNAGRCHILSNILIRISGKILKDKQSDNIKLCILELSARLMRVARRIRNLKVKFFDDIRVSTPWLSVLGNDNYLNILVKINEVVYDDECDTSESVDYDITDIVFRLNESVDWNIYTNTLEEIEYDNEELIKKFYKKLEKLGFYKTKNIAAKEKFLSHIKNAVTKK